MKDPTIFFNVVLVEPEIPQNTGNIGRTCVGIPSVLHLVGPLGFEISDRQLKRAGLDYWPHLSWHYYSHWESFLSQVPDLSRVFLFSTHASQSLYELKFQPGDWLIFGRETQGLGENILSTFPNQSYVIPMYGPIRSLNLATSVAIVLYEGGKQITQSK